VLLARRLRAERRQGGRDAARGDRSQGPPAYSGKLRAAVAEFGPAASPSQIDPDRFAAWFTGRWGERSPATWNATLATFRSAAGWWAEQAWITADPSRRLRRRTLPPDRSRALTRAYVEQLLRRWQDAERADVRHPCVRRAPEAAGGARSAARTRSSGSRCSPSSRRTGSPIRSARRGTGPSMSCSSRTGRSSCSGTPRRSRTRRDAARRQGGQYQLLVLDERTLFPPDVVSFLESRVRSGRHPGRWYPQHGQPGRQGHGEVKKRFIDATNYGERIITDERGRTARFVPAKLADNPHLNPEYAAELRALPEKLRRAFLDGDWSSFAGAVFPELNRDRHVVRPFTLPDSWPRYVGVDWGYTAPWAVVWATCDGCGAPIPVVTVILPPQDRPADREPGRASGPQREDRPLLLTIPEAARKLSIGRTSSTPC
jgi:hypothetical protein